MVLGKQTKHYHEDNLVYEPKKCMELKSIQVKKNYLRYLSPCPDYLVVHLQLLMIPDPMDQSGIRPDNPVVRYDTYTDWSRLDGRVGVCVMAFRVLLIKPTPAPSGGQRER